MKSSEDVSTEIVPFFSSLNKRELPYCAILPAGYHNAENNFPVLYLLHGLFGRFDNWLTNTEIINYARAFPFVIICAEGGDNWYMDSAKSENHFYETYLAEELIPDVEQRFKVRANRNSRSVAGLSMGGYGAFKLALRRPELFYFAGSMSGAFHAAEIASSRNSDEWIKLLPSITEIFGSHSPVTRSRDDLFELVNNYPPEQIKNLPYFYFDCGKDDSFLPINRRLAKDFFQKKVPFEFHEFEGSHDWDYWNLHLPHILRAAERYLRVE